MCPVRASDVDIHIYIYIYLCRSIYIYIYIYIHILICICRSHVCEWERNRTQRLFLVPRYLVVEFLGCNRCFGLFGFPCGRDLPNRILRLFDGCLGPGALPTLFVVSLRRI